MRAHAFIEVIKLNRPRRSWGIVRTRTHLGPGVSETRNVIYRLPAQIHLAMFKTAHTIFVQHDIDKILSICRKNLNKSFDENS